MNPPHGRTIPFQLLSVDGHAPTLAVVKNDGNAEPLLGAAWPVFAGSWKPPTLAQT